MNLLTDTGLELDDPVKLKTPLYFVISVNGFIARFKQTIEADNPEKLIAASLDKLEHRYLKAPAEILQISQEDSAEKARIAALKHILANDVTKNIDLMFEERASKVILHPIFVIKRKKDVPVLPNKRLFAKAVNLKESELNKILLGEPQQGFELVGKLEYKDGKWVNSSILTN